MAEQASSTFSSLEALRKEWASRANSKRKQSAGKQSPTGEAAPASEWDASGSDPATSPRPRASTEERLPRASQRAEPSSNGPAARSAGGGPPLPPQAPAAAALVPQVGRRSPPPAAVAEDDKAAVEPSDSEDGRSQSGNAGVEPKLRRGAEAGPRQPPSLSVMRPLGDFGATADLPLAPATSAAPGTPSGSTRSRRAARPPASAGAAAAGTWKERQTPQQLSSGTAVLGRQVIAAVGQAEKEQAILKLYAVLCQTAWVSQPGLSEQWAASYLGLLELGLPRFVRHAAALVLRRDRGYSDLVRSMAAAVLKTLMQWMERQMDAPEEGEHQATVRDALDSVLSDGAPGMRRGTSRVGIMESSPAGYGNLLDTDALEGLLDPEATPGTLRPSRRGGGGGGGGGGGPPAGAMETNHMFGSLMDTGSLEALVSAPRPRRGSRAGAGPSGVHLTGTHMLSSFGSALDTGDVAGHMMEHKGALRATIWLFKSDQPDAWCAAASLVGSIGLLGGAEIDAMGGHKLVKPLMWVLRSGDAASKAAAMRALAVLSHDIACRTVMARQDKYLRAMVRILQGSDAGARQSAVATLNMLLAHDPSTHWVLARSGVVPALVKVVKQPLAPAAVAADATLGLKHLTSSSQRNREALLQAKGVPTLIRLVQEGNTDAQYNSARILRHLAMGGSSEGKAAACQAIPALVRGLQAGRPRVCFACAAALAMVTEGQPEACALIEREGGVQALVALLTKGGGQGKKVAAEALQAMAAESEAMRPRLAAAGCIKPLVQMLHVGNLQQQAAAAGAVQAIAYCPSSTASLAAALAAEGVVQPLAKILRSAPRAMRCAAAGALCNLALRAPAIQAQIVAAGALEALVDLLVDSQPDGQYSAAAALANLASVGEDVRAQIADAGALPPLLAMLTAESWYCRIVAADLLAHLGSDGSLERSALAAPSTLAALAGLLCLQHTPGTLEEVGGRVAHLAYERSQDIIVMKGYKFARAKVVAAALLGVVASASPAAAQQLAAAPGVARELAELLPVGHAHVQAVAAAAIADLAHAAPEGRAALLKAGAGSRLAALIKAAAARPGKHGKGQARQAPGLADAAGASAALLELCRGDEEASRRAVSDGVVPPLLAVLEHGDRGEAGAAARLLTALQEATPAAAKAMKHAEHLAEALAAGSPASGRAGASAALLQAGMVQQQWGYAITAKPSANLYILLQVPFEALLPPGVPATPSLGPRSRPRTARKKGRRPAEGARREGGAGGKAGGEPLMAPVDEASVLETGLDDLNLEDNEQYEDQAWRPAEPQPGQSAGDILETWVEPAHAGNGGGSGSRSRRG